VATGREKLVRGVELVGTPLARLEKKSSRETMLKHVTARAGGVGMGACIRGIAVDTDGPGRTPTDRRKPEEVPYSFVAIHGKSEIG
jgi:hypothetical protein